MTTTDLVAGAVGAFRGVLEDALENRPIPADCKPHHHARVPYPKLWEKIIDPDGHLGTRVLMAAMLRANVNGCATFGHGELVSWLRVRDPATGGAVPVDGRRVTRAIQAHIEAGTFGVMSDRRSIDLQGLALNGARKGTT